MESLYTAGPSNVSPTLTEPSKSFKQKVILALIVLILFMLTYFILMFLFGLESYRMLKTAFQTGEGGFLPIVGGIMLGVLCIFMFKSLFIFKKRDYTGLNEITEETQPVLFDFLYKLADEAGAPRPHKVFLTMNVNASVFYDLSFINLLWPTKKNLNIGMGLINVLNVGELKAVLAHEFGHFAQRSMLLGRYVYVAQQIMVKVVYQRDVFDKILSGISSIDIRIAWIGWILSILVWAIRSLIETLFTVVNILEKALSREMEFQADLVAVSMTGSDALIHALHKLRAADEGFHGAIDTTNSILSEGKRVEDVYALQSNYIEKMRWVLDDPEYGKSPRINNRDGSERVFKDRDIAPPEMWSTHPADNLREENAKKTYIYSDIDDRSSWLLINDAEKVRKDLTEALYSSTEVKTISSNLVDNLERMNTEQFDWSFLNPKYHGNFYSRYGFRNFKDVDELLSFNIGSNFKGEYDYTYPNSLKDTISRWTELHEEKNKLKLAKNESVTIEKRQLMYRGEPINRSDIPEILDGLDKEESDLKDELKRHDSRCRTLAYKVALKQNPETAEYIKKLNELVLYTEHKLVNLSDMQNKYGNTLSVVLADGRVSSSEMNEVLSTSSDLYHIIRKVFLDSKKIEVGDSLEAKLGKPYKDLFEEFKFQNSTENNISSWVDSVGGWYQQAALNLTNLRNVCLEHLLNIEERIKEFILQKEPLEIKSEAISIVSEYERFLPGAERELQLKLGFWDRFHTMDGLWPTIAKFAASIILVGGALALGNYESERELILFNGLGTEVSVFVEGNEYNLYPHSKETITIKSEDFGNVLTLNSIGDTIEYIESEYDSYSKYNIYNIAKAAGFVRYNAYFGYEGNENTDYVGNPNWVSSSADYCLTRVPDQIRVNGAGAKRTVLEAFSDVSPVAMLGLMKDDDQVNSLIKTHAMWDDSNAKNLVTWLSMSQESPYSNEIMSTRFSRNPTELVSMRMLMDQYDEAEKNELCEKLNRDYASDESNADLFYLKTRCLPDGIEQNKAFVNGAKKWPNHVWLNYAASLILANDNHWKESLKCASIVVKEDKGLASSVGVYFDRIKRICEARGIDVSSLRANLHSNTQVEYLNELEQGSDGYLFSNYEQAMFNISQGNLELAARIIEGKTSQAEVKVMLGASDGANQEMVREALNVNLDSIGGTSLLIQLGLHIREKKNYSEILGLIELDFEESEQMLKALPIIIKESKEGQISESKKDILFVDNFQEKNLLFLMAKIATSGKIPIEWDERIEYMFYGFERPYFE